MPYQAGKNRPGNRKQPSGLAPGSNPGAPTTYFCGFNELFLSSAISISKY